MGIISDLQLYDTKIIWNQNFLKSITNHFPELKRLGFPANCIDMPTLVSIIDDCMVQELIIKNSNKKSKLQAQDLAMLFKRFSKIEIEASLITDYPSIKNKTEISTLSIQADTHNFFISLLLNIPSSVKHLIIENTTNSTNNLVFDVSQKNKYNTKNVNQLTLQGFDNNLKQITTILNNDLFKSLKRLNIIIRTNNDKKLTQIEQEIKSKVNRSSNNRVQIKAIRKSSNY